MRSLRKRYRRKGIGRALMNTLLEHFQRNGIDIVNLDVPTEQEAAVEPYKKRLLNPTRSWGSMLEPTI
ncbi:GNAT family N-acetyltransferase [Candidatus Bathyarchaeota archaeon]|nr:MAG: GNAT family N-acetyltransferase [Candidatus Bathyarchaeota archaeon]